MKLKKYLNKVPSLNRWCEENGIAYATIQRHIEQDKAMSPYNAARIELITGGAVSSDEVLYPKGKGVK